MFNRLKFVVSVSSQERLVWDAPASLWIQKVFPYKHRPVHFHHFPSLYKFLPNFTPNTKNCGVIPHFQWLFAELSSTFSHYEQALLYLGFHCILLNLFKMQNSWYNADIYFTTCFAVLNLFKNLAIRKKKEKKKDFTRVKSDTKQQTCVKCMERSKGIYRGAQYSYIYRLSQPL